MQCVDSVVCGFGVSESPVCQSITSLTIATLCQPTKFPRPSRQKTQKQLRMGLFVVRALLKEMCLRTVTQNSNTFAVGGAHGYQAPGLRSVYAVFLTTTVHILPLTYLTFAPILLIWMTYLLAVLAWTWVQMILVAA